MCVVSMVGDHYRDLWGNEPWHYKPLPGMLPHPGGMISPQLPPQWPADFGAITRAEFDELKRQVTEMKELLKRAKAYDEANGEPDCEIDEKMVLLKKIAGLVGIDLDDVLKPKAA